jgi:hypothetical protein
MTIELFDIRTGRALGQAYEGITACTADCIEGVGALPGMLPPNLASIPAAPTGPQPYGARGFAAYVGFWKDGDRTRDYRAERRILDELETLDAVLPRSAEDVAGAVKLTLQGEAATAATRKAELRKQLAALQGGGK